MSGPSANLVKWWAKRAFEEGTVRRHLSPNEVYPLKSLIESMPSKATYCTSNSHTRDGTQLLSLIASFLNQKLGGSHLSESYCYSPVHINQTEFRQAKHTIILVQYTRDPNSRKYLDFESVNGGMDGVVKMYEAKLRQLNPDIHNITYDIQDLYNYIDSLADLSALVLDLETKTYLPCGKEWIKKKVFQVLKNQAG
uniref:Protein enhancer of rudimentary putative n=1 Tax=Albugo laibachii Nc14 TaxID=890382 RepID=F0WZZ2_9STRA|nr:protein enhancer of rudimentary putative [Albugo laibachii Nc14]|eukprot:CCA27073.1 protein enhancer of rudimentary putative [Albugo laibachii Nc14]